MNGDGEQVRLVAPRKRVRLHARNVSGTALAVALCSWSFGALAGPSVTASGDVDPAPDSPDWIHDGTIYVGKTGVGAVAVEDGGTVLDSVTSIGYAAGSSGTATISGAGSNWTTNGELYVGESGSGSLTIEDGGYAFGGSYSYLGANAGSSGTVTVSGAGSLWQNESLLIGYAGNGTVTIEDGAEVTANTAILGYYGGSYGTATVTGPGSSWTIKGALTVGNDGSADLTVADGGSLSSRDGTIGRLPPSDSSVTVTGAGSTWTISTDLEVGVAGTGTLTIADGGSVSNRNAILGNSRKSASGTAIVTGSGSSWTNSGDLTLGRSGQGSMTVTEGGSVTSANALLGVFDGASGTATVSGEGSTWTSSGDLTVGAGGRGTGMLTIEDGGAVSNANATLGNDADWVGRHSIGTALVTGAGSTWTNTGTLTIGNRGTGTLTVEDGGSVTSANALIGGGAGSSGTATVSGEGSSWTNSGTLTVGVAGTGTLTIADGGAVSDTNATVGDAAGSTGTALVTGAGSAWTHSGDVVVGNRGAGSLTIADGGTVEDENGYLGLFAGSTGSATVSGPGSSWSNSADLTVGDSGSGSLTIEAGGTVSDDYGYVGRDSDGSGTVTVTDSGSSWSSDYLLVGYKGSGALSIENGGTVSAGTAFVGYTNTASGAITVSGPGSSLEVAGGLTVGNAGLGSLTIADGGSVTSAFATLGSYDASGSATVSGAGSSWINSGALTIGREGVGALTVTDGGSLESASATLASLAGSTGTALVTGAGSSWTNTGTLTIGSGGAGTLTIAEGAQVSAGTVLLAADAGSSGTLAIGAAAGAAATSAGTLLADSLAFGPGAGGIVFNHTDTAYTFAPALSGAGTIDTYSGTTVLAGANGGYSGTATLHGGTLSAAAAENIGGASLVFDGGTLQTTGSFTLSNPVSFNAGGGTFETATDTSLSVSSALVGTGPMNKTGAGFLELTGASPSFFGPTTISAGELQVDGSLAGSVVTALAGTTLSGLGTVGGVVAQSGSTIAPGNSPGTLTVAGDYVQASGSTYAVELVGGSSESDLIQVGGQATIESGAMLDVSVYGSGSYSADTLYTILTAAGGLTGTYDVTGDSSAFYALDVSYGATAIELEVLLWRPFVDAAVTGNQFATAAALQSLPVLNPLRQAVGALQTDALAQAAFDSLSGEIYPSIEGAMAEDSRFIRNAAIDRIRAAFDERPAPVGSTACGTDMTTVRVGPNCVGVAFWAQGYGVWGNTDGNGNAASLSHDTGGFLVGADTQVFDSWRVGILGGYSRSTYGVAERDSSASSDNYSLGLYGGTEWERLGLRLGGAYTWSDVSANRNVVFPGFADSLGSSYGAGTGQVFADLGYQIGLGQTALGKVSMEPFANLAYVSVQTDGFTEQGGLAALNAQSGNTDVTFSTLGLRGSSAFVLGGMDLKATAALGWRHAFGDTDPTATVNFAGSDLFTVAGVPIAEDAALVEAGLSASLAQNVDLNLSYTGQFGSGTESQGLTGKFSIGF